MQNSVVSLSVIYIWTTFNKNVRETLYKYFNNLKIKLYVIAELYTHINAVKE